jgi:hypothetical protein
MAFSKNPFLLSAALFLCVPLAAYAQRRGGLSDGGGMAIVCGEGSEERVYLADTFVLRHEPFYEQIKVDDPSLVITALTEILDFRHPEKIYQNPFNKNEKVTLGWLIKHTSNQLTTSYDHDLQELGDDNVDPDSMPKGCKKRQVAIQDLAEKVVHEEMKLTQKMSFFDRGLLDFHEALVSLRNQPLADTTPIRAEVEAVVRLLNDPQFYARELALQLWELKFRRPHVGKSTTPAELNADRASAEFGRACPSHYLLSEHPEPQDTPETTRCRLASRKLMEAETALDLDSALPTLLNVPKELDCLVTYKSSANWEAARPTHVRISRVSGDGRPNSKTIYRLRTRYDWYGWSSITSSGTHHFYTNRHQRMHGRVDLGLMDLRISFGKKIGAFFHYYDPFTDEFVGSVQFTDGNRVDSQRFVYVAYGLVCRGDVKPEIGIDTKQSYY